MIKFYKALVFGLFAAMLASCDFLPAQDSDEPPVGPVLEEADPPASEADDEEVVEEDVDPPEPPLPPEADRPSDRLPAGWFSPPGQLTPGGARDGGNDGFVLQDDEGDVLAISDQIIFPIESGPAFPNSQIFGKGGNGFGCADPATCDWPPVPGAQNAQENYDYPWRDNFCEVRDHLTGDCAAGRGHQGQDIRPATCSNGTYWAVAPERVKVRNVGSRVLVNLYGVESGQLHTMMHLDRPLAFNERLGRVIQTGDELFPGERIGRISNMTSLNGCPSGRCTSLHLHYEIWDGATETGSFNNRGTDALPLYSSLVNAYVDHVNKEPAGEDWVAARAQPPSSACSTPQ